MSGKHSKPTSRKKKNSPIKQIGNFELTRRQLVGAGIGAGVLAASGGGVYLANKKVDRGGTTRLSVPKSNLITQENLELIEDNSTFLKEKLKVSIDYNTLVWANYSNTIALLEAQETGSPLSAISIINIENRKKTTLQKQAINANSNYQIIDIRANDNGYVWVESNILTGNSKVYSCKYGSDPVMSLETDNEYLSSTIAISENKAWCTLTPAPSNNSAKTQLFSCNIGEAINRNDVIFETKEMATSLTELKDGIVFGSKSKSATSSYDLIYLNESLKVQDCITLPQSIKPQDVSYSNYGFSFTLSGSYSYGEGISDLGTYVCLEKIKTMDPCEGESDEFLKAKDERCTQYSQKKWLCFNREPNTSCACSNNLIAIKSTTAVAIINVENNTYCIISKQDGSDDYGVWLSSCGDVSAFATLSNIDYTQVSGDHIKEGRLSIWQPV